jgi:hypothetical protein
MGNLPLSVGQLVGHVPMSHGRIVKILFLAANPSGTDRRSLDQEIRRIELALERAKKREHFTIVQRWAVTDDDLLKDPRVQRDVGFSSPPAVVRSAFRRWDVPSSRSPDVGFRLARTSTARHRISYEGVQIVACDHINSASS